MSGEERGKEGHVREDCPQMPGLSKQCFNRNLNEMREQRKGMSGIEAFQI
jgi:hypothetical protein